MTTSKIRLLFTNPSGAFVGVSELQSWSASSTDAAVTVGGAGASGSVVVSDATTVSVTVRATGKRSLTSPRVALAVPDGWTARPTGSRPGVVHAGRDATWRFTVAAPADAAPGSAATLTATATYRAGPAAESTHRRQALRVAFPPGHQNPVGAWSLDEGSGTVAHDVAGGHDATLTGGATWTAGRDAAACTALQLSGSGQAAQTNVPVLDTAGSFTASAWVRLDRLGSWATAVSQDGDVSSGFYLQYSQADNRFAFSTSEGRALADAVPETGRWYHLVGVHDADQGTYTLYVDGVRQAKVWAQAAGDAAAGRFAIGRGFSGGGPSDFWPGAVDQVSVWGRALTSSEVAALA
ncbi:LamG-like jellyroll fold domain-containing protein [Luteimicrobium album]|uniref:LamG-like jellyroll fold domain-containing protein n=1 Tax=Luteimicrobium album TaxID=1054550 RepID=UPI0024E0AFEF|nr:LamG-like jellyroll fold domain-containing protein [Luteimicrobium album]